MSDGPFAAAARAAASDALAVVRPDACLVERNEPTESPGGAAVEHWVAVGSYGCRVQTNVATSTERVFGGRVAAEADLVVFLPYPCPVTTEDRITVGGRHLAVVATNALDSTAFELAAACRLA